MANFSFAGGNVRASTTKELAFAANASSSRACSPIAFDTARLPVRGGNYQSDWRGREDWRRPVDDGGIDGGVDDDGGAVERTRIT
jgi:hypothetical protein